MHPPRIRQAWSGRGFGLFLPDFAPRRSLLPSSFPPPKSARLSPAEERGGESAFEKGERGRAFEISFPSPPFPSIPQSHPNIEEGKGLFKVRFFSPASKGRRAEKQVFVATQCCNLGLSEKRRFRLSPPNWEGIFLAAHNWSDFVGRVRRERIRRNRRPSAKPSGKKSKKWRGAKVSPRLENVDFFPDIGRRERCTFPSFLPSAIDI